MEYFSLMPVAWSSFQEASFRKQQENRKPLKNIAYLNSGIFSLQVHMDRGSSCKLKILYHYTDLFLPLVTYLCAFTLYCMSLYEKALNQGKQFCY